MATRDVILFLGEMFTATAMGFFEREIARAVARPVRPAGHFERRQLRLAGLDAGHPGTGAREGVAPPLVEGGPARADDGPGARRDAGTIGFLRIAGWSMFTDLCGPHWFAVAATVGVTLLSDVLWCALVGSMLPFGLHRLGFDPATSSAPFVATLVDVTGVVIYFSVGVLLLRGTLL
jgi:magnesium transporter